MIAVAIRTSSPVQQEPAFLCSVMPGDAYVLPTRKLGRKGGTTQAGGRGAGAKRLRCSGAQPTPTTLGAPSYIAISADLLYFYSCTRI